MMSDQSRAWREDEASLLRDVWDKARRVAGRLPFAEDLLSAYYCALDRQTPLHVRASLLAALAYFVMPADALPDLMVGLGFTDDAAVLFGTLKLVTSSIRPEHRDAARRALNQDVYKE
jgi:uncharacterized membrane protein YkvA (DUF1232 family)